MAPSTQKFPTGDGIVVGLSVPRQRRLLASLTIVLGLVALAATGMISWQLLSFAGGSSSSYPGFLLSTAYPVPVLWLLVVISYLNSRPAALLLRIEPQRVVSTAGGKSRAVSWSGVTDVYCVEERVAPVV